MFVFIGVLVASIMVVLFMYIHDADLVPLQKFIITCVVVISGLHPLIHLNNYYSDKGKTIKIDDTGLLTYTNGEQTLQFNVSDIESVTKTCPPHLVRLLFFDLGYYSIAAKGDRMIQVSVFTPIQYIIDYAEDKGIYNSTVEFMAIMD